MVTQMMSRNWRDLIRPKAIHIETDSSSEFYGKFTCEPLERGFGITIGNSLRRVLLASLQGAAISAIRIDGALHEFTTIPDVVEDVTDIILNLKEVVFKAETPRTYTVRFEKEGPGLVTAGDIQLVDGLSILNPSHAIATLDKKGPLSMEHEERERRGRGAGPAFLHAVLGAHPELDQRVDRAAEVAGDDASRKALGRRRRDCDVGARRLAGGQCDLRAPEAYERGGVRRERRAVRREEREHRSHVC